MKHVIYRTGKMPMLLKVSIGFFLGIMFGLIAAPFIPYSSALKDYVMPFLNLCGKIFLRLLEMIIVPLVVSSLISGVSSIGDTKTLGRIGMKTIILYVLTTLVAIFIGLACGYIFKPGAGVSIPSNLQPFMGQPKSMSEMILDIFPRNPLASMVRADMLQIIVFSLFAGVACIIAGETGKKFAGFFDKFAKIMYSITHMVMELAPYGVFALISTAAAEFGLSILAPFMKIIAAVYSGCFIHAAISYSLMMILFCRKSPLWFFRGIREAAITAFVTSSSSVTLPVTLANVRENLGVSEGISSFVISLGATVNMDGTAIYEAVCALFVAQAFQVPVTGSMLSTIVLTTLFASIGAAGIPGAGLIMLTMVLSSIGLPLEGVGMVAGIDVILSAARTCINVEGDAAVCAVVAASEGEALSA